MRKNIVLISFDDAVAFWKYKNLFGAELQIPNLERIRSVSTTFQAAYSQSPLCGPSRASFMSGRSPLETGILDNRTKAFSILKPRDIWSHDLKRHGFFCSSGGKVHHGYVPLPERIHSKLYSDDRKFFPRDLKLRPGVKASKSGGAGGGISTLDPDDDMGYYDARSAQSFANFIESYDGDAPFYREVGFFSPHNPFITPNRFKKMYEASDFQYPAEWDEELKEDGARSDTVRVNFRTYEKRHWQKSVRNYFSAISHGDHHLGTVWDALQSSRHAKNTIVVILTDHGLHLGEKRRFGKSTLLEQVANVPLILHDPDNAGPREINDAVGLIDIGPTVLDLVGLPKPAHSLGWSLRPLMNGKESWPDRPVPTLYADGASIRMGRYRFTRYRSGKTTLHDLVDDWWQRRELGPEHPDYEQLDQAHREICAEYGAAELLSLGKGQ